MSRFGWRNSSNSNDTPKVGTMHRGRPAGSQVSSSPTKSKLPETENRAAGGSGQSIINLRTPILGFFNAGGSEG